MSYEHKLRMNANETHRIQSVASLLKCNRTEIDALKAAVQHAVPACGSDGVYLKYDDIFMLRYILSFGTAEKAKTAVLETLAFRSLPY